MLQKTREERATRSKRYSALSVVGLAVLLIGLLLAATGGPVQASTIPNCRDLSYPLNIGQKCKQTVRLHARGDDDSDTFRTTYDSSWIVLEVNHTVFTRYGNTSGPNIRDIVQGTRLESREAWARAVSSLENLKARLEASDSQGQSSNFEYVNNQLQEARNNYAILTSVNTNVGVVEASVYASRRCTGRTPLGCVDWQGGSLGVDLTIYKMYVGTPQLADQRVNLVSQRIGVSVPSLPTANLALQPGFANDPRTVSITSGGPNRASTLRSDCVGYIASAPDYTLDFGSGGSDIRFYVTSTGDTTLLVRTPSGAYHCNDDWASGNRNPMVVITNPPGGRYAIWVGSYSADRYEPTTLYISEYDYLNPSRPR